MKKKWEAMKQTVLPMLLCTTRWRKRIIKSDVVCRFWGFVSDAVKYSETKRNQEETVQTKRSSHAIWKKTRLGSTFTIWQSDNSASTNFNNWCIQEEYRKGFPSYQRDTVEIHCRYISPTKWLDSDNVICAANLYLVLESAGGARVSNIL